MSTPYAVVFGVATATFENGGFQPTKTCGFEMLGLFVCLCACRSESTKNIGCVGRHTYTCTPHATACCALLDSIHSYHEAIMHNTSPPHREPVATPAGIISYAVSFLPESRSTFFDTLLSQSRSPIHVLSTASRMTGLHPVKKLLTRTYTSLPQSGRCEIERVRRPRGNAQHDTRRSLGRAMRQTPPQGIETLGG